MSLLTRRKMLKNAALPIAGTFALPISGGSSPGSKHSVSTSQAEDHGCPHGTGPRAWAANAHTGLYRPGTLWARRINRCCCRNGIAGEPVPAVLSRPGSPECGCALGENPHSGIFAGAQGGQYTTALTGVEIALWDLAGKALGLPVYQLLGGKFRDKIRIYCDSDMEDPLAPEADKKMPWIKDQGFTAMKIDLDEADDPESLRQSELDRQQRRG